VELRSPPDVFHSSPLPNYLRFRLNPQVTVAVGAMTKSPGEPMQGERVELVVSHNPTGEEMDAYERLLGDAMHGDATLFAREDSVEAAWRIVGPVLGQTVPVQAYEPNTWGPASAAGIGPDDGWHDPSVT
jgi:glucose-6-phosphate 1-dehydrogenase